LKCLPDSTLYQEEGLSHSATQHQEIKHQAQMILWCLIQGDFITR